MAFVLFKKYYSLIGINYKKKKKEKKRKILKQKEKKVHNANKKN